MFIPVASPICLRRLRAQESPELGIIMPEQDCYPDYQKMLDSVTAEEFAVLVLSQNPAAIALRRAEDPKPINAFLERAAR